MSDLRFGLMVDTESGVGSGQRSRLGRHHRARDGGSSRNETRTHRGIVRSADRPKTRFAHKDDVLRALRGAGRDSHTKFREQLDAVLDPYFDDGATGQ